MPPSGKAVRGRDVRKGGVSNEEQIEKQSTKDNG